MSRRGGEKALKSRGAARRDGEADKIERIGKPIDLTVCRLADDVPRDRTGAAFQFDQVGAGTLQGEKIARRTRGMVRGEIRKPISLAGHQLARILNELDGGKAAVPGPNTFHGHSRKERVAIVKRRLNLQVNGVPTWIQGDHLSRPLRKTGVGPEAQPEPRHAKTHYSSDRYVR